MRHRGSFRRQRRKGQSEPETFKALEDLQKDLAIKRALQPAALQSFYDTGTNGFRSSQDRPPGKLSPSSTSTCISSLVGASQWRETVWAARAGELVQSLLVSAVTTTGLSSGNVYTEAFLLEGADVLLFDRSGGSAIPMRDLAAMAADPSIVSALDAKESRVKAALTEGYARIGRYPPSGYMTQLAVRVLRRRANGRLDSSLAERAVSWASAEMTRQLALILAGSKTADYHQLAYCALIVSGLEEPGRATPDQRLLVDAALERFFTAQLPDGTWPRSAPIFDLPGVGSSYCYEYEMLAQLLLERRLEERLLNYLPSLRRAYESLVQTAFELPGGALAWSSGHRQQVQGPESWATASAYHFIHAFERLISEAVRRSVFRYLRSPYVRPSQPRTSKTEFAPGLLDSQVVLDSKTVSLKEALFESFVAPIVRECGAVESGAAMGESTPNTMILFGPPGTSKTELTKAIAEFIGWPRLSLDPSHFVRNGIDRINPEADLIFSMLSAMDRVVVLLDEIDELVRDRAAAPEVLSRFITTSMLPKLANINKGKRVVFIVATNHIEQFDIAISRPGRFDVILQVMPPTVEAKLGKWPVLQDKLSRRIDDDQTRQEELAQLTFDECARLATRLADPSARAPLAELAAAFGACTLNTPVDRMNDQKVTWRMVSQVQQDRIRGAKIS